MCGIFGYISKEKINLSEVIPEGLKAMDYRGYDSSGLAMLSEDTFTDISITGANDVLLLSSKSKYGNFINLAKAKGKIDNLTNILENRPCFGSLAIGHTRWATHGQPTALNAHPHYDADEKIFIAHNGIIENYEQLREFLITKNRKSKNETDAEVMARLFKSETDTEIIAHLIAYYYKASDKTDSALIKAFVETLNNLEGTYGLVMFHTDHPELLLTAKHGSPVLLGLTDKSIFVASDGLALIKHTNKTISLDDGEVAVLRPNCQYDIFNLKQKPVEKNITILDIEATQITKNGYESYMLKEICEQAKTLEQSFAGRFLPNFSDVKLGGLDDLAILDKLKFAKQLVIIGCGSAFYAAKALEYFLEEYADISVETEKATEFGSRDPVINCKAVYIFISQSGETADTIQALNKVKAKGATTIGIVNVVGSTIAKMTDAGIYTRVGPEIGVASTKAFTAQVLIALMIAIKLGRQRNMKESEAQLLIEEIKALPKKIGCIIKHKKQIESIAKHYLSHKQQLLLKCLPSNLSDNDKLTILKELKVERSFTFLGRKFGYPIALEGALKLKEIAYVATEGFPSGELKHGPIAMVDNEHLSIFLVPRDITYKQNISSLQEVKARQGLIFTIATKGDKEIQAMSDYCFFIPKAHESVTPILETIVLQLFAYYMAKLTGHKVDDIDKPRNLAKSVTVG